MKYHELKVKAKPKTTRPGRGIAAGKGKTAGRGTKGQKARAGFKQNPGFAGGQNPLMQQLPKLPGFRSYHKKKENVFTDQLNNLTENPITSETLAKHHLISNSYVEVKLLYRGDLKQKVNVNLNAASATAIDAIETMGGSFTKVEQLARPKKISS